MFKIEKYTGEKTYMYPTGAMATPEDIKKGHPAVEYFTHIVETDEEGQVLFGIENLAAAKSRFGIPKDISEEEAIKRIEEIRNAPQDLKPSLKEREVAALEFSNVLNM